MTFKAENIHPAFNALLGRKEKESFLKQHAKVIWLTGLSGSGKTTIAAGLEKELYKKNFFVQVLDGDNIRSGINSNLGFSEEDRKENIRRIAEISKLFLHSGIITVNCFVSPAIAMRKLAQDIIGADDFIEVYINAPIEVCEQRDVKGLYKKARKGEIKNFTGIHESFEPPLGPALEIKTDQLSIEESIEKILSFVLPKISYKA